MRFWPASISWLMVNLATGAFSTSASMAPLPIAAEQSTTSSATPPNTAWINLLPRWWKSVSRSGAQSSLSAISNVSAKVVPIVLASRSLTVGGSPTQPCTRLTFVSVASDQYGNYLVQYILTHSNSQHRETVAVHIRYVLSAP